MKNWPNTIKVLFEFPSRVNNWASFSSTVSAMTLVIISALGLFWIWQINGVDPLETWNRQVQILNDRIDDYAMIPMATAYKWVTPEFFRKCVTNFFANFWNICSAFNELLQGKWIGFFEDCLSFFVNAIVGIGGMFDISSPLLNLPRSNEDFDQTLGVWGVSAGPYLVLPFFGPSSCRGLIGFIVDLTIFWTPFAFLFLTKLRMSRRRAIIVLLGMFLLSAINNRADWLNFSKIINEAIDDKYTFIRDVYLQTRVRKIHDEDSLLKEEESEIDQLAL